MLVNPSTTAAVLGLAALSLSVAGIRWAPPADARKGLLIGTLALLSSAAFAVSGYLDQEESNQRVIEAISRLPPGATKGDLIEAVGPPTHKLTETVRDHRELRAMSRALDEQSRTPPSDNATQLGGSDTNAEAQLLGGSGRRRGLF